MPKNNAFKEKENKKLLRFQVTVFEVAHQHNSLPQQVILFGLNKLHCFDAGMLNNKISN